MLKEIKYLVLIFIICLFLFLTGRYYFSDTNKRNSYRSINTIDEKINSYAQKLPILEDSALLRLHPDRSIFKFSKRKCKILHMMQQNTKLPKQNKIDYNQYNTSIRQKISPFSKFSEFWCEGFLRFLGFSVVFH